ncbi:hypothetical protein [Streptomyces melanogenes]|uniref:hypothetical protein n=1 Tax=Streptomyces melanogenes TaxID=67326 RepID=UPI0037B67928
MLRRVADRRAFPLRSSTRGPDSPTALRAFDTNAVGLVRVTQAALPLLRKSANPTVVTISSSAGSFWAVTNPDRVGRTPKESARVVVRLATLDADGPTGTFQDESGEVPW